MDHNPLNDRSRQSQDWFEKCAGVAQLVRVPACHAGGRGFEPRHSRHFSKVNPKQFESLFCIHKQNVCDDNPFQSVCDISIINNFFEAYCFALCEIRPKCGYSYNILFFNDKNR